MQEKYHLEKLTKREMEVLRLVVLDYSNPRISEQLKISIHTAKAHVSNILSKFYVDTREDIKIVARIVGVDNLGAA